MNIEKSFLENNKLESTEKLDDRLEFCLKKENLENLKEIPENQRGKIIGRSLEYSLIFPNDKNWQLTDLLYKDHKDKVDVYIQKTAEFLNISDYEGEKAQQQILEYLFQKFVREGNYYHAFNGSFLKDIKEKGLSTKERFWDIEKIKNIHSILEKAGYKMSFGWFNLNSIDKLSVSDNCDNIYDHAIASPEWFAQFVAEGWHIPDKKPYDKEAYYKGDYQAAKRNLNMFLDRLMSRSEEKIKKGLAYPNISREERDKILEFFDEYWVKFQGETKPQVAVIKKSVINKEIKNLDVDKYFSDDNWLWLEKIEFLLESENIDQQIDQDIKAEDFQVFELPEYNEVYPESE